MKIFKNVVTHNGYRCDVSYTDSNNFDDISDELILKAHAVCFCDDKMLLVGHPDWNIWGIPGGTREKGESIEQTLIREILEETNCEVLNYSPIGYQKIITPENSIHYRAQYICNVKPIGEFKFDVGGNIDKIKWINPQEFKKYIEKKEFKEIVIQRALDLYLKQQEIVNRV